MIVALLLAVVWLALLPLVEWAILVLAVGKRASLRAQVRASGYSLAPLAVSLVPLVGCLALPWSVGLKLVASSKLQKARGGAVLLAVVMAPVLLWAIAMALRLDAWVAAWLGEIPRS
jgi:hypothetical protein